jgi:hypothetical protein
VVASGVVTAHKRYPTDRNWARHLLQALGGAVHADIAGVDLAVGQPVEKRSLREASQGVAVDMESHIAAAAAEAHGLPFAACRVIIDPAHRPLPPAALIDLRPDGTPDIAAVAWSVLRQPSQLPALLRVAADARAAQLALHAGRQRSAPAWAFRVSSRLGECSPFASTIAGAVMPSSPRRSPSSACSVSARQPPHRLRLIPRCR